MKKLLLALAIGMALLLPVQAAADISVSLTLDRREAAPSDTLRLVVSVSGARQSDAPPVIQGLDLFHVSPGGSSSRVEIVNGRITSGIDYTYYISPKRSGKFKIGPARVEVDGRSFQSNTVSLTVAQQAAPGPSAKGPLSLTATLSTGSAYVEEQVLYTLKLFLRTRVSNISLELPEQDHLTFQQLGKPKEYQSVIDGAPGQVVEVRYALMGLREGDYRIQPARMEMTAYTARQSRRGFFDDPFFSDPFFNRGQPTAVVSEAVELTVNALPSEGKPADFSGLVGRFTIASELTPPKIRAGESATLTVRITGRGNVNRIPDLKLPDLDHLKVYTDEPVFSSGHDHEGVTGSKTMKWAIVPELPGDYAVPALSLSFFDPQSGQYRLIESPRHPLAVIPAKGKMLMVEAGKDPDSGVQRPEKEEVKTIGHDILPLHTSVSGLDHRSLMRNGLFLWGALFLPVLVYIATFVGLRLRNRTEQTLPAQRARKAARHLIRECQRYRGEDAKELLLGVRDYFNDRFGLALAALTPVDAMHILKDRGVASETAGKLANLLEEIENVVYTGNGRVPTRITDALPEMIREIEKEIQ